MDATPANRLSFEPLRYAYGSSSLSSHPSLLSLKDDLKALSREDYNRIFAHSAVKRAKYEGLLRTIQYLKRLNYHEKNI